MGRGGIVTDPTARADAIERVVRALAAEGIGALGVIESPITGTEGNVEFLVSAVHGEARSLGEDAIAEGAHR